MGRIMLATSNNTDEEYGGTYETEASFEAKESVTLPFTATKTGFVYIIINPQSVSGGYASISIGTIGCMISSANGNGNSMWAPVNKGETVSIASSSNVTVAAAFRGLKIS